MSKIYKVGIVFEYEPDGEHDFLFEDMNENERVEEMLRLAGQDISQGFGSVSVVEIAGDKESQK